MARRMFSPDKAGRGAEYNRRYAAYELAYTIVDFTAAGLFVVGSVMFFFEAWQEPGTWCFLIGSICFALKPTIRLVREVRLAEEGKVDNLARRLSPDEDPND
jgi:hypothetical protein